MSHYPNNCQTDGEHEAYDAMTSEIQYQMENQERKKIMDERDLIKLSMDLGYLLGQGKVEEAEKMLGIQKYPEKEE